MAQIYVKALLVFLSLLGTGACLKLSHEGEEALHEDGERHSPGDSDSSDPLVEGLLTWLHENGALSVQPHNSSLRIIPWITPDTASTVKDKDGEEAATGRAKEYGVITPNGYDMGSVLISLPPALWVVGENISEGRTWKGRGPEIAPQVKLEGSSWDTPLALWVLQQKAKGDASFFAPYITFLPTHVPSMLNFSPEEIAEVQYKPLIKNAKYYVDEYLHSMHRQLQAMGLIPPELPTLEDYRWAATIVWSRSFTVFFNRTSIAEQVEEEDTSVSSDGFSASMLLPFFDMLNHNNPPDTQWEMEEGQIRLVANVKGAPGSVVHDSYGHRINDDFAMGYGFILEHNPHDRHVLFPDVDELLQWYKSIYGRHTDDDESPDAKAEREFFETTAGNTAQLAFDAVKNLAEMGGAIDADVQAKIVSSQDSLSIWPEGRVEPRLLAILAAVGQEHAELNAEPSIAALDYKKLAELCIFLAQDLDASCTDLDSNLDTFVTFAANAVRWKAEHMLSEYATTMDQDRALLDDDAPKAKAGGKCAGAEGGNEEASLGGETCEWKSRLSANMKLIVKLRLEKKKLLQAFIERMDNACADAEDDETNFEGFAESMHGHWEDEEGFEPEPEEDESPEQGQAI